MHVTRVLDPDLLHFFFLDVLSNLSFDLKLNRFKCVFDCVGQSKIYAFRKNTSEKLKSNLRFVFK